MPSQRPIVIAGGGPVGVVTALALARQGFEVRLFEAETRVNDMPRAATTHAATLEMLEGLGLVEEVTRRGLIEPKFRIWDRASREMIVESLASPAGDGEELLAPIIDGEFYRNVTKLVFRIGPRVRIPKVVAPKAA